MAPTAKAFHVLGISRGNPPRFILFFKKKVKYVFKINYLCLIFDNAMYLILNIFCKSTTLIY